MMDHTSAIAQIIRETFNHAEYTLTKRLTIHAAHQQKMQAKNASTGPIKLLLINPHSPGDIIMMTAAIRDLYHTYPGEYHIAVDTPCPEIFEGNPYLTPVDTDDPDVIKIRAEYPLIHQSNQGAYHFIHGYRKHLEEQIGRPIIQGDFNPDIHIRDEEKSWISAVEEITKDTRPYWIIDAGYKQDFTAKAWSFARYQAVVDAFKDRIQFVQIGHAVHFHPKLKGVINMVGQTDLRQLIRLVYHSAGVLTPVSMPMVLASAVPVNSHRYKHMRRRPCVVVAGGREPVQWQHLPDHQFLHTCGTMTCCPYGGCWRSRVVPLGDGDDKDKNNLCLWPDTVENDQVIARCMSSISTADVVAAIEKYYNGGILEYDIGHKTIEHQYQSRDTARVNTYIK